MAYWLFQSNPKHYRVLDAIRNFEEVPWLIKHRAQEIQPEDGVLIWMAGPEAGVYAIAEVLEPAHVVDEPPDLDYWIDPKRAKAKPYVKIRFIRKLLGQPLRRMDLKHEPVLKQLSVIQQATFTVYEVTPEQWLRVYALKG